jgi:hypothetical protein
MKQKRILAAVFSVLLVWAGPASGRVFYRGDANGDRRVDISDAVHLVRFLFLGGPPPSCEDAADANDDGRLDLADVTSLLAYLFLGGPQLPPPYEGGWWAGYDGTPNDPFTCGDFPEELDLSPDQVFDRLTRCRWVNLELLVPIFPTGESYRFRRDGTYSYFRVSDYVEADDRGIWDFEPQTPGGGTIYLVSGDALRFSLLADGTLLIRDLILSPPEDPPCTPDPDDCSACTWRDLPPVGPSDVVEILTARPWWKADDFNRRSMPDSLEIGGDGRYREVFRDGECVREGYWSLYGRGLILEIRGKTCDLRHPLEVDWPTFDGFGVLKEDRALRLNPYHEEYIQGDRPPAEGLFAVEIASTKLGQLAFLRGEYLRPLARGMTEFRFALEAGATSELPAMRLRIAKRGLKRTPEGLVYDVEEVLLAEMDLPHLAAGESYEFTQEMDLGGDGDLVLHFTVGDDPTLWLFPDRFLLWR